MTRLKFDVTGVDPGGDFATPKPGTYTCKIDVIEQKTSQAGNEMLEVQYVIQDDGEFQNSRLWDYIVLNDSQAWKYRRFLEAIGAVRGSKEKGEIDIDKLIGKKVLVKVTNEKSEEWGERARVGSVARLTKSALKDTEPEEEDIEEDELDDDEEELTADDIMHMKKTELKELSEENELGLRVTKQTKLANLRKRVVAKMIEEEMIEDPDEEEPEDEDLEDEELEDEELEDEEDEDEDDEEDDEDDEVEEIEDYAELSVAELRAELKERGLSPKGSKGALVKRLEKDDEDEEGL